jgi:hypothetical protein
MFALNLVSRGKFALPHRRMTEGETIARIEFASEDDSMWFQRTLRWNAFGFVKAPAIEGHVVNGDGSRTPMETGEVITSSTSSPAHRRKISPSSRASARRRPPNSSKTPRPSSPHARKRRPKPTRRSRNRNPDAG